MVKKQENPEMLSLVRPLETPLSPPGRSVAEDIPLLGPTWFLGSLIPEPSILASIHTRVRADPS